MPACATGGSSPQEAQSKQIIQRIYQDFGRGDINAVVAAFSPDIEWRLPAMEGVPLAGTRHGREQVMQFFGTLGATQEVLEFQPSEFRFIAEGDQVVVLGNYRWRVKATGRAFGADWVHVFTLRNGQVVRFDEFTDTAAVVAAYRR